MFKRNRLEEWYEGKYPEYDISECGMVNTISPWSLNEIDTLKGMDEVFFYGNSEGENYLIDIISTIYTCKRENVLVTNGASEALFIVLLALCDDQSKIMCQFPYYNDLQPLLKKIGCSINRFELDQNSQFSFIFEKFKSSFESANVAILNFPNNPTGSELKNSDYANIISYSEKFHKHIIFDEVTALSENKTYIEKNIHCHLDNCVCINSMSKAYGVPGLRVGWIVSNERIIRECQAIKELISVCTPPLLQKIAFGILKHRDMIIRNNQGIILQNINSLLQHCDYFNSFFTINRIPENCPCCLVKIPNTIDDYDFCLKVYDTCNILLTPGKCFDLNGYFRLGLGINPKSFNVAMHRLNTFARHYFKRYFEN